MSDEEALEATPQDTGKPTYEQLQAELAATRREAAGRRVDAKEAKALTVEQATQLQEYAAWKESQKSELERLTEAKLQAERDLAVLRTEKMQTSAALEAGLDPDLADRIRGDSYDEMIKDAKALAEKARPAKKDSSFSATRGEAVRTGESSEEAFRNWINNQ